MSIYIVELSWSLEWNNVYVQKDTRGQELMDEVCQQLDLIEKDYFGLRYVDIEKQRVGIIECSCNTDECNACRVPSHFGKSWKVIEFKKGIFQAWKVI